MSYISQRIATVTLAGLGLLWVMPLSATCLVGVPGSRECEVAAAASRSVSTFPVPALQRSFCIDSSGTNGDSCWQLDESMPVNWLDSHSGFGVGNIKIDHYKNAWAVKEQGGVGYVQCIAANLASDDRQDHCGLLNQKKFNKKVELFALDSTEMIGGGANQWDLYEHDEKVEIWQHAFSGNNNKLVDNPGYADIKFDGGGTLPVKKVASTRHDTDNYNNCYDNIGGCDQGSILSFEASMSNGNGSADPIYRIYPSREPNSRTNTPLVDPIVSRYDVDGRRSLNNAPGFPEGNRIKKVWFAQVTPGYSAKIGFLIPENFDDIPTTPLGSNFDIFKNWATPVITKVMKCKSGKTCYYYYDLPISSSVAIGDVQFDKDGDLWFFSMHDGIVGRLEFRDATGAFQFDSDKPLLQKIHLYPLDRPSINSLFSIHVDGWKDEVIQDDNGAYVSWNIYQGKVPWAGIGPRRTYAAQGLERIETHLGKEYLFIQNFGSHQSGLFDLTKAKTDPSCEASAQLGVLIDSPCFTYTYINRKNPSTAMPIFPAKTPYGDLIMPLSGGGLYQDANFAVVKKEKFEDYLNGTLGNGNGLLWSEIYNDIDEYALLNRASYGDPKLSNLDGEMLSVALSAGTPVFFNDGSHNVFWMLGGVSAHLYKETTGLVLEAIAKTGDKFNQKLCEHRDHATTPDGLLVANLAVVGKTASTEPCPDLLNDSIVPIEDVRFSYPHAGSCLGSVNSGISDCRVTVATASSDVDIRVMHGSSTTTVDFYQCTGVAAFNRCETLSSPTHYEIDASKLKLDSIFSTTNIPPVPRPPSTGTYLYKITSGTEARNVLVLITNDASVDTDGDGIPDLAEYKPEGGTDPIAEDTDADGFSDSSDRFPQDNSRAVDTDGDYIADWVKTGTNKDEFDNDQDGDYIANSADAFPLDPTEFEDTDGDKVGNKADTDDDDDDFLDDADNCSLISNHDQVNIDNDLNGDACDNCPLISNNNQLDTDSDSHGDECDEDDDNDSIIDINDNCRLISNNNQLNTDGDSYGNECDNDDDNDGVPDAKDGYQLISVTGYTDTDHDGIPDLCDNTCSSLGMSADKDNDNDYILDVADNCRLISNYDQLDTDGDSHGDECDDDDDSDYILDVADNCPLISNPDQLNTDGDSYGNECDDDDDNDYILDVDDHRPLISDLLLDVAGWHDSLQNNWGFSITPVGNGRDIGRAVAQQQVDGDVKLVVAGYSYNGSDYDIAVARYNIDGTLDTSFGTNGKTTTPISGDDFAYGVVIQDSGKIVIAGSSRRGTSGSNTSTTLVRYDANGVIDNSFGSNGNGIVTSPYQTKNVANAIIKTSDNKLVTAGSATSAVPAITLVQVLRYTEDGILDGTFGSAGVANYGLGATAEAYGILSQYDDQCANPLSTLVAERCDKKLVVAGKTGNDFMYMRLTPNGQLDTSFGSYGKVQVSIHAGIDKANSIIQQSDGKLVAAGATDSDDSNATNNEFALVRLNTDGSLDTGFGNGGKVVSAIGTGNDSAFALVSAYAEDGNGSLVVAGSSDNGSSNGKDVALAVFDGGDGGLWGALTTTISAGDDTGYGLLQQTDGKWVVAGESNGVANSDFAILRYIMPE